MTAPATAASDTGGTVFLSYARALFDYLTERGYPLAHIMVGSGLKESELDDPERTISTRVYADLWRRAVELTGDANLGLHVGEIVRPSKYGVLGYAMMSCETLSESLLRQQRYQDLVGKTGRSDLATGPRSAELRWHSPMARQSRHIGEEHLASWVAFARWMLGVDKKPLLAQFEHEAPADLAEHRRIFGCELRFRQNCTAIAFPLEYLKLPVKDKDPAMRRMLDNYAENLLLQRSRAKTDPIQDVRDAITRAFMDGVPEIEAVAAQLKLNVRALQRRLSDLNLTYKELLDDVRSAMALQYINNPKLDLTEIAFLLGFAEQSSFQRAFKRWTGKPPGQYRGS